MKRWVIAGFLLTASVGVYAYYTLGTTEFVPEVRTADIVQGDIVDTVGATGTLEAVTTVSVGSQVSGIIQDLFVDYNSIVRKGDVIMRLDPSLFQTQTEQARANLVRAQADVEGLRVALDDARMQLSRAEDLANRRLVSQAELEAAQVAVRSAEAQLKSSEAAVTQAEASLHQTEVNLEHTVIRAPIDGIVISRLVDVGQTVAASLQAPELFVIAADLTKMRVIANIDESDVGRIRPGQRVAFTVDAFPAEEFEGRVSQVRLEPVVTQNVVTYATVIEAPNPDLRLKPGMTATVTLETARREDVLRIPNQALRFRPTAEVFALLGQPVPESMQRGPMGERAAGSSQSGADAPSEAFAPSPGFGGSSANGADGPRFAQGGTPDPDRRRQIQERMAQMSPEEREAFIARRRAERGTAAPRGPGGSTGSGAQPRRPANATVEASVPTVDRGATTIDALFGPLPPTESTGQVWVLASEELRPVTVRLGATDGTATELLDVIAPPPGVEIGAGTRLVTQVTTPDSGAAPTPAGGGSPLIPQFGPRRR